MLRSAAPYGKARPGGPAWAFVRVPGTDAEHWVGADDPMNPATNSSPVVDARTAPALPASGGGPLWPALSITWLCSLGSSVSASGVFFVASQRFGFTSTMNLVLALLYGVTYIVGAASCGWVLRRLAGPGRATTPRRLLGIVMILMAAISLLPIIAQASWAIWVFVGVYSPLGGWLWPLAESYVASGRSGNGLRRAIGRFNIAWASAVAVGLWFMAPLVQPWPLWVIGALGVIHLACLPIVARLGERPKAHGEATVEDGIEDHALARRLLMVFRCLLVTSFILFSALTPLLPDRLRGLDVSVSWQTPLTSTWMICRLGIFGLMESWHGWHGRWRTVIWAGLSLVTGFGLAITAGDLPTMVIGLALFGIGFGGSYCAALYYAMLVGASDVDAGGKHEAIIGVGYTVGPLAALIVRAMIA